MYGISDNHEMSIKKALVFICNTVSMYMYRWMDVCKISSTSKVNLHFSNENTMTDFHKTWYVGIGGHKYYPRGLSSPNAHIQYLICIVGLIG